MSEFIKYIDRSYEQIKQSVLAKLPAKLPRHTDHSESEPLVRMLSVWAGIAEMLGLYINDVARETHLPTMQRFKSAVKFAKAMGYRVRGVAPASVNLRFYFETPLNADVSIPLGTEVQTADEIIFTTVDNLTILSGQTEGFVDAVQQIAFENILVGTSDGSASQVFELADSIVDKSISVLIDSVGWDFKENFFKSFQTDTHFVARISETGAMEIVFGDDVKGAIPLVNEEIRVNYAVSQGALGNVAENTITDVVSTVSVPPGYILKVNNPSRASGGADRETLAELKVKIPLFNSTKEVAATRQEFIDVALLAPGVGSAGVFYDCGKFVEVYIAPTGGGTATQTLLDSVSDWFNDSRRIITTNVSVKPAGVLQAKVRFAIQVQANFVRATTVTNVRNNILAFLSAENQRIGGRVKLNDLIEVVETTDGVDSSDTIYFYVEPFARPLADNTATLDWTRTLKPASNSIIKWVITFSAANKFRVSKDGVALGQADVGQTIIQDEVEFTINSTYSIGQKWEFYTYPYTANLLLKEPSVVLANAIDVLLDAEGGI